MNFKTALFAPLIFLTLTFTHPARADGLEVSASYGGPRTCEGLYSGSFRNLLSENCYRCPTGFKRNGATRIESNRACVRPKHVSYRATPNTRAPKGRFVKTCPGRDWRYSPATKRCHSCGSGWSRTIGKLSGSRACKRTMNERQHARATFAGRLACRPGDFHLAFGQKCYSCPPGTKRKLTILGDPTKVDACKPDLGFVFSAGMRDRMATGRQQISIIAPRLQNAVRNHAAPPIPPTAPDYQTQADFNRIDFMKGQMGTSFASTGNLVVESVSYTIGGGAAFVVGFNSEAGWTMFRNDAGDLRCRKIEVFTVSAGAQVGGGAVEQIAIQHYGIDNVPGISVGAEIGAIAEVGYGWETADWGFHATGSVLTMRTSNDVMANGAIGVDIGVAATVSNTAMKAGVYDCDLIAWQDNYDEPEPLNE